VRGSVPLGHRSFSSLLVRAGQKFRQVLSVLPWLRPLARLARRRPKTTAVVLILLGASGAAGGLNAYALYQYHAAQEALQQGRPSLARQRLQTCLAIAPLVIWPGPAELDLLAARAAWMNGDFDAADEYLKECIRLRGAATQATQLEYLLMRAQTGDEPEVAIALFDLVEKKHPQTPVILETMARVYMRNMN